MHSTFTGKFVCYAIKFIQMQRGWFQSDYFLSYGVILNCKPPRLHIYCFVELSIINIILHCYYPHIELHSMQCKLTLHWSRRFPASTAVSWNHFMWQIEFVERFHRISLNVSNINWVINEERNISFEIWAELGILQ